MCAVEPAVTLDAPAAPPGGRVAGWALGADVVELVRREQTPAGRGSFRVAESTPAADGRFALELPADAAPSVAGERCALDYAVVAVRGSRRDRATAEGELRVEGGPVQAHLADGPHDRLIASFDARRFHVELAEADLRGGGGVAGRVHANRASPPDAIVVCARLLECWRISRQWNACTHPLWHDEIVWESEPLALGWPAQRRWLGFGFRLPPELPPAFEGRVLAWRYEVEARRPVRFAPDQRAVLTPMGFLAA
jgi:hypothetical protein